MDIKPPCGYSNMDNRQPWLSNARHEVLFILAPALLPVGVVFLFQDYFITGEVSTWWWVALVLCIDVGHVYSTLFRLYWDERTFRKYRRLLVVIPLAGALIGFSLHYYDAMLFWRMLAYVAVYHFIRQQYGFMRLYSRRETSGTAIRIIDSLAVYSATLYPLLHWHIHGTDKLAWFVKGDFIKLGLERYDAWFFCLYLATGIVYTLKETYVSIRKRSVNIPKNLVLVGTYASWYVGIVYFKGDLIFTMLNVVAHGIPYMALIWLHGEKKGGSRFSFDLKGVAIFVGILLTLAYIEENLWDSMVWRDHTEIFPFLSWIGPLEHSPALSIAVALLVLPQVTHYVLDGFIWRFSKDQAARL